MLAFFLSHAALAGPPRLSDLTALRPDLEQRERSLVGEAGSLDWGILDAATTHAKVVGLGEATHGTHELMQLRAEYIEHVVDSGVPALVLWELPVGSGMAIDESLSGPSEIPRHQMFQIWQTEEVFALLDHLRASRSQGADFVFAGIDPSLPYLSACAFASAAKECPEVAAPVEALGRRLGAFQAQLAQDRAFPLHSNALLADAMHTARLAQDGLSGHHCAIGGLSLELARFYLDVLRQGIREYQVPEGSAVLGFRDWYMAENTRRLLQLFPGRKTRGGPSSWSPPPGARRWLRDLRSRRSPWS